MFLEVILGLPVRFRIVCYLDAPFGGARDAINQVDMGVQSDLGSSYTTFFDCAGGLPSGLGRLTDEISSKITPPGPPRRGPR